MKNLSPFSFRHSRIAANIAEVAHNLSLVVGAANAQALSGEEWEILTPFGDFPNKKGLQRVTPEIGNRLVTAFNSLANKAKNLFRGVPIFVGHPDVQPDIYTDHRRYGKLEAVRVGAEGIEGKIAWNDLGEQNQKQGYYVYPSIVWYFKSVGNGVIEPFQIASIGLTNTPNIPGVKPWTKNDREIAANAGTSAGALKGWETRRAGGVTGAKNPRAAKAKAAMAKKGVSDSRHAINESALSKKERFKLKEKAQDATSSTGKAADDKYRQLVAKAAAKKAYIAPKAEVTSSDDKGKPELKISLPNRPETSPSAKAPERLEINGDAIKKEMAAHPERFPGLAKAPSSTSSSSGAGTHVHVHLGGETPAAKKGFFSKIVDAFAKPHVHDGGAANSRLPYLAVDGQPFYGVRRRRVAVNAIRKNKPAAA